MDEGTAGVGAGQSTEPSPIEVTALILTTTERAPSAVIAARSFSQHHPAVPLTVVVVDDRFGEVSRAASVEPGTWMPAARLVSAQTVSALLAEHPLDDALTLVQPLLVATLLDSKGVSDNPTNAVVLLGDHVELVAPITQFIERSAPAMGGFVPVRSGQAPVDGRLPDPADLVAYGHFQRGLAVFTARGHSLVQRWADGLAHHPLEGDGRFNRVAHPWFDELVLSQRGSVHIAQPGLLQSFRNLDAVTPGSGASAFSFEGFSPSRPWVLSELAGEWPRVLISAHPMLQAALDSRFEQLTRLQTSAPSIVRPYDTLPNGHRYDASMRLAYTESLHHALRHGGQQPPNPFAQADDFVAFLAAPSAHRPGITRHLEALSRQRPDLGAAFSNDDGAFRRWAMTDAVTAGVWTPIPAPATRPSDVSSEARSDAFVAEHVASGINVVGLLSAQLGIGEQGRLALRAIRASAIPYSVIDHDDTVHRREANVLANEPADGFRYDVDVLLLNADQTSSALTSLHRGGKSQRPTVGLWAWESPVFPQRFHSAYQLVSEVWVASSYIKDTLLPSATAAGVSVEVLPLQFPYVNPRGTFSDPALLASFGLDSNRPYFAFMFDYFSVAERKQPWAAVEAFRLAFPRQTPGGPQLVIKSLNHEFFPLERERLLGSIRGRTDVVLLEQYLSPENRTALIANAAGYVSLHRAEGLGLTMAEAMGAGTPVVATGWSGNMEFMTAQNSWLVDSHFVDIPNTVAHYGGAGQWAEPSVEQAATYLGTIIDNPAAAQHRSQQAIADLVARNASGADAAFVVNRIRSLRACHGNQRAYDTHTSSVPGGTP